MRSSEIHDEVRSEFQRFGMVDASEVTTRVAEEWEFKNETAEGLQSDGGNPGVGGPAT